MSAVYSEPQYVLAEPATALLSETRPTSLTPAALAIINFTLDELLQLWVHTALSPSTATHSQQQQLAIAGGASSPSALGPGPLNPSECFTTERFKLGVIRVIGPYLGKNTVLEAELALRELLRMGAPSLRADPALRKNGPNSPSSNEPGLPEQIAAQADDIFRSLRAWLMEISGLGVACPSIGPASLANHLLALTPPPPPPGSSSPHLTFMTVLYAERCLSFVAEYLVRAVGRVNERGLSESVDLREVEAAFGEDESIWSWLRGMRVRAHLEAEVAASKARGSPTNLSRSPVLSSSPTLGRTPSENGSSYDSSLISSTNGKKSREKEPPSSSGLGIDANTDDFESLLQGGRTMKLSLTPDRLRTMERLGDRSRKQSSMSQSSSMPVIGRRAAGAAAVSAGVASAVGGRRFEARAPRPSDDVEVLDDDESLGPSGQPKQTLMDLLSSPPPWNGQGQNPPSNGGGVPSSIPMRLQDSQTSTTTTGSNSDVEPVVIEGPGSRLQSLRAKDERMDLMSERQVNHDLVDFFSAPPPKPTDTASIMSGAPTFFTAAPSIMSSTTARDGSESIGSSPARKRGGFKNFFSKGKSPSQSSADEYASSVRGSSEASGPTSPTRQTNNSGPVPPRDRKQSLQAKSARLDKGSPELDSAAALLASGFSETAVRKVATPAYRPPPNLGAMGIRTSSETIPRPDFRTHSPSTAQVGAAAVALGAGGAALAFSRRRERTTSSDRISSEAPGTVRSSLSLPPGLSSEAESTADVPPFVNASSPIPADITKSPLLGGAKSSTASPDISRDSMRPASKRSSVTSTPAAEPAFATPIDASPEIDSNKVPLLAGGALVGAATLAGGAALAERKQSIPAAVPESIREDKGEEVKPTTKDVATATEQERKVDAGVSAELGPSKADLLELRRRMLAASTKEEAIEVFDQMLGFETEAPVGGKAQEIESPTSARPGLLASSVAAAVVAPFAAVAAAGSSLFGAKEPTAVSASEVPTQDGEEVAPAMGASHESLDRDQAEYDEQFQGAMFEFFLSGGNLSSVANINGLANVKDLPENADGVTEPNEPDEDAPVSTHAGSQSTAIEDVVGKHRNDGSIEPETSAVKEKFGPSSTELVVPGAGLVV